MVRGILSVLSFLVVTLVQADQIISTSFGKVQGNIAISRDEKIFHQFLGIPYAKAERFQAPVNPDPWNDVRDATKHGPVCPQIIPNFDDEASKVFLGSEDCLNLNVFSPKLPLPDQAKVLLPVMVWFHGGGGDVDGAMNYDPQYYMDTDIVLVTFNARLGFLGYLNLGNEFASGNQRLKDQVLMLKWVQENIENFGGDPARDGSPLMPHMFIRNPIQQAKRYGEQVGCPVESKEGLLECLKGKRPEDLVLSFHRWDADLTENEFLKFGPSLEYTSPENAFMIESPFLSLSEGRISNKVPWITSLSFNSGFLAYTSKIITRPSLQQKLNTNILKVLPRYLDYEVTAKDPDAVTRKIMEHYFNGEINATNAYQLVNLITYRYFTGPSVNSGDYYPDHAPTYALMNKYVLSNSVSKTFGASCTFGFRVVEGANGDEISFQFPWPINNPGINKSSDYTLSKNFIQLLISFAETGKPTKTWGEIKSWLPYHVQKRGGVTIENDGSLQGHSISKEYINSHKLWAPMFKNDLAAEFENPAEESF
ncbi:unnamed protein product [Allacma fusca]|uniref:Carboxylesterase type B domain-containing protein n=1 Tax=Allacma fusca TaxID=39272 RepID=A0A8J2P2M8_9HEXA|nr:unnamed protein product [Allacma fusca]